jgi:hypothetical protein
MGSSPIADNLKNFKIGEMVMSTTFRTYVTKPISGTDQYHIVQSFHDSTLWGIRCRKDHTFLRDNPSGNIVFVRDSADARRELLIRGLLKRSP